MNRGGHVLTTGPAGVKGSFVGGIMLLLDGISVGGQNTRERKEFTPVMSVTKHSSHCKCLASTISFCVAITFFFFFIKKIFIFEIPFRRKMLYVSPATNILIIDP